MMPARYYTTETPSEKKGCVDVKLGDILLARIRVPGVDQYGARKDNFDRKIVALEEAVAAGVEDAESGRGQRQFAICLGTSPSDHGTPCIRIEGRPGGLMLWHSLSPKGVIAAKLWVNAIRKAYDQGRQLVLARSQAVIP